MTIEEFERSLDHKEPPTETSLALQALWWEAKGDWEKAHHLAQEAGGIHGNWVHAYLHRKEGDQTNASYWYNQSGHPRLDCTFEQEWRLIAEEILND